MRRRGGYRGRGLGSGRRGPGIWTGNFLKMIAMVTMLADHIAVVLLERGVMDACGGDQELIAQFFASELGQKLWIADRILRGIGRLSFPILCFLLTEGFFHSRDRKKYALRLGGFALVSEVFFDLAIYGTWFYAGYQNALFTLLAALLVLMGMERFRRQPCLQIACFLGGCAAAWILRLDYGVVGILLPVVFYWFRSEPVYMAVGGAVISAAESAGFFGSAALACIPILLYNGKRGYWRLKYCFYIFYPAQFLVLYLIRLWLVSGGWMGTLIETAVR